MEDRFEAAYRDGVTQLAAAVEAAVRKQPEPAARLSAGLGAALEFLAANPARARLLLVEVLAAGRPARLEHERSLARLAEALARADPGGDPATSAERARLLAGGLTSFLSAELLAGEAERLPESHDLLLSYLRALSPPTRPPSAGERHG